MALILMLFSGVLVGLGNYFMRRSMDAGGDSRSYILIQLFLSAIWTITTGPLANMEFSTTTPTLIYGVLTGACLAFFMRFLGQAMARGPVSLTVAFINASTLLPALIFYLVFGKSFGFEYKVATALGSLLVLFALFQATKRDFSQDSSDAQRNRLTFPWLYATMGCLILHTFMLVLIQLRSMSLCEEIGDHFLLLKSSTHGSEAFLPIMFVSAWIIQWLQSSRKGMRWPVQKEWLFGCLGGLANGSSIQLMAMGTFIATGAQAAMMFPLYSVSIIVTCNLWGLLLYKESVYWPASILAITGIAVGTINWSVFF